MKERGKSVEKNHSANYYSAPDVLCKIHPSSSSVGICPRCLKDRLIKLVCSDCGEQRLSSCSCSDLSSYRNSSAGDVGSVGRISFLIENERTETRNSDSQPRNGGRSEEVVLLRSSSSSCVRVKRSRVWKISRLFRKKRDEGYGRGDGEGFEDKSELWVFDEMRVSMSRSLCSFRGGCGLHDPEGESGDDDSSFPSAKVSDVKFNGGGQNPLMDSGRESGFSEAEPRKSGFKDGERVKRGGVHMDDDDDSGFIDLKLESLESESKSEFSVVKATGLPDSVSGLGSFRTSGSSLGHHGCGANTFGKVMGDDDGRLRKVGSCRITVNDDETRTTKKEKINGYKVWMRWILRHHPNWRSGSKEGN